MAVRRAIPLLTRPWNASPGHRHLGGAFSFPLSGTHIARCRARQRRLPGSWNRSPAGTMAGEPVPFLSPAVTPPARPGTPSGVRDAYRWSSASTPPRSGPSFRSGERWRDRLLLLWTVSRQRAGIRTHMSGRQALVAQRIGRPPPERKVVGSNPIQGTRPGSGAVPTPFLLYPPGLRRCSHNGQCGGFPSRRRGSDSRTPLHRPHRAFSRRRYNGRMAVSNTVHAGPTPARRASQGGCI